MEPTIKERLAIIETKMCNVQKTQWIIITALLAYTGKDYLGGAADYIVKMFAAIL